MGRGYGRSLGKQRRWRGCKNNASSCKAASVEPAFNMDDQTVAKHIMKTAPVNLKKARHNARIAPANLETAKRNVAIAAANLTLAKRQLKMAKKNLATAYANIWHCPKNISKAEINWATAQNILMNKKSK